MQGMRWILQGREKLCLEKFAVRQPEPQEIVIKVISSGINFADAMMIKGLYADAPAYPFTPGYEVSGKVVAIGSDVQNFKVGDEVIAGCHFGGHSSHICLPAKQCAPLPAGQNVQTGASVVVSFLTAWLALSEYARIRRGDRVLVDCASGALGQMIAQMARKSGAHLTGLTSSRTKLAGILKHYDKAYTHDDLEQEAQKFDLIIQSRGGPSFHQMIKRLRPGGRMVALGVSDLIASGFINKVRGILRTLWGLRPLFPASMMNGNYGVFGLNVLRLFEDFELLQKGLAETSVEAPTIDIAKTFDYRQLEEAFKQILSRELAGKVLLSWKDFHAS